MSPMLSARHTAVAEYFPKLAYTTSDIVVVVCREPFYNRRYLERCLEFAKRANAGVTNVDRPALVLLGNKLPGEECVTDVNASTGQFFSAWGEDAKVLDSYFSAVVCLYMPHKGNMWRQDGTVVDGADVFHDQIGKLRHILQQLALKRMRRSRLLLATEGSSASAAADATDDQRLITQHCGLWFTLLPYVVQELNSNRGVNVTELLDRAWASAVSGSGGAGGITGERDLDVFMTFLASLRPPRALSMSAPRFNEDVLLRYELLRKLMTSVTQRLLACRLRRLDPGLLVETKVRSYVRSTSSAVLDLLDGLMPCFAELDCAAMGVQPVTRQGESVLCLEEARVHGAGGGHRCSRRVRPAGNSSLWNQLLAGTPYNATWEGHFKAPLTASDTPLDTLVEGVWEAVHQDDRSFLEALLHLQQAGADGSKRITIGFVPLPGADTPLEPVQGGAGTDVTRVSIISSMSSSGGDSAAAAEPAQQRGAQEAGVSSQYRGGISASVRGALQLMPALPPPQDVPYCVGCGRRSTDAAASGQTDGLAESCEAGVSAEAMGGTAGSWWGGMLSAVGLAPPPAQGLEGGGGRGSSAAAVAAELEAELARQVAEDTAAEVAQALSRGATVRAKRPDLGSKRVSFSVEGASVASDAAASEGGGGRRRGGLSKAAAGGSTDPATHYVWLGLCQVCWNAVHPAHPAAE